MGLGKLVYNPHRIYAVWATPSLAIHKDMLLYAAEGMANTFSIWDFPESRYGRRYFTELFGGDSIETAKECSEQ